MSRPQTPLARRELLEASAAASALAGLGASAEALGAVGRRGPPGRAGVVAGVVIETVPGAAPRVAARLLHEPGLVLQGGDGDRRLAAVFTGAEGAALEALAERLVRSHEDVLGVFPTYVANPVDGSGDPGSGGARP
ncbi:hypothetical protein [Anaeromyxobacter terrae]|uniref:hypothetical protein n=1 Tax=Anaeromyxobacter terrae TaxID=2925406 RepID=UPI001F562908|nr:hypothetical protein [Anaeromyxobacter sp. SG22]